MDVRVVAILEDAVYELYEVIGEGVDPGQGPNRGKRGTRRTLARAGWSRRWRAPVNQAECVALVSGDCRADAVAGLLSMVKIGVEANIRAEMQIGAERVTLLVKLIGADLGCRRERRAATSCSCRSCRGSDREVAVVRTVVAKPRLAVQREIDLTIGAQGNEFER